jgi:5-methylcytosine-specific restriction protein A
MVARPCIEPGCGQLTTNGTRCPDHAMLHAQIRTREHDRTRVRIRPTREERGYDRAWRRIAARTIAAHPYCAQCGATEDLTCDHLVPRSLGGTAADGVRVLCRRCNGRRGKRALGW